MRREIIREFTVDEKDRIRHTIKKFEESIRNQVQCGEEILARRGEFEPEFCEKIEREVRELREVWSDIL